MEREGREIQYLSHTHRIGNFQQSFNFASSEVII